MAKKIPPSTILPLVADTAAGIIETQRQEALLKTGALQNAIFNSANFSKIATDENGVIQLFNVGAERMLGYAAADVVNKITPADISDPQELIARAEALSIELATPITPGFEALVYKASRGIEDIYELTYIRQDGSRFPAVVSVTALRDAQGTILGYLLIGTDNTARKQAEAVLQQAGAELERLRAEAALRVSEQHYRTLLESIDEGFCIIEKIGGEAGEPLDFRYIEANPAFAVQSGISGVVGKTLRQVIPDEFEEWLVTFDAVLKTGESISFERELATQGRVLELHAFRVEDDTHRRVAINFKDITQRRQADEQLRQNRDTFFNLVENAPFGMYVVDAQFRMCQASAVSLNVFSSVHPLIGRDFEEIVRAVWTDPFASEVLVRFRHTLETGEPYVAPSTVELRKDIPGVESYDWKIHRITLPNGQFGVVCYFYDVTEQKLAEDALRERDAFTRSIINSSPDCIKVLDLQGNLLSMQSGQALLGIEDIQPFLNTSWIDFWEGEHRQAAQAAIALALTGEAANFVGFFRTHRDEPKWWDVAVSPILDADGKPERLLTVSRDVTERRQAELNFEFLASASRDLVHWTSMDEMMQSVGAKVAAHLHLSLCAFAEIDEAAEQVVIRHDWHRQDVPSLVGVHRLADFVEEEFLRVARAAEVIVVRDVATDSRTDAEKFATLSIASFVCVPLIQDGQWRFALCLYKDVAYDWREDEIELARELTARIWSRLERLRAEAALRESEQRYRTLFESIDEGFCIIEKVEADADALTGEARAPMDFRYIEANAAFEVQSGVLDVVGKTIRQVVPSITDEWLLTYDDVLRTGESTRFEREFVDKGRMRVLEVYTFRVQAKTQACVAVIFKDVTARKQAEKALLQRTAQFKTLIDEAPLGIHMIDADFRIRQVNSTGLPAFGNIPDLIGRDFAEVMHILWPKAQADATVKQFRHTLETGEPCFVPELIEKRADRKTTEYYEWQISRIALPEGGLGVVCYFRDIAERVLAQQKILESEARYRSLFNSMDEGYCIIEMIFDEHEKPVDYRYLEINPSFANLTGMHGALGKRVRELVPDLEEYWFEIYGKVALTGEPIRFINEAKPMNRWFDVYAFQIGDPGSRKVAILFNNITERKQSESNLKNAMASAEKANRAKSDFLSSMSHELRTPLNAILGFAQLMQSGSPPPTALQKRSLDQILKGGWYLLELINEILDLALIESGKVALSREPVPLAEVLIECRAMIEPQAHARGIELTFPTFETPPFVQANRTRLKQVLLNFLSNAVKYNKPSGAVVVACSISPPDSIRISVRDTGEGLDAQQLAQLFEPFNRLGKESSSEEGTGIGLVVTKRLVELMGGEIGAESTVGAGSVFWIELHLASAPQIASVIDPGLTTQPLVREWASPRTVLYVEDNPANLELVEQLIARRPDLHLLSAVDGALGIEFARDHLPDVILMDISLPGINGLDLLKTLREDPATAHIPVVAISAYAMPHDVEIGLEAGFLLYLTKPIIVNEFMEALDRALAFAASAAAGDATGAFAPAPGQVGGKSDTGRAETL